MRVANRLLAMGLSAMLVVGAGASVAYADPKSELAEAARKLEVLGGELSGLQDDLAVKTEELELTDYAIGEKQAEIEETNERLDEARVVLGGRMRSAYKSGGVSIVQLVMGSTSIEDLVSRIYYMDKVAQRDAEAISNVQTLEGQLRSEQEELKQTKSEQESAVSDLQAQVADYDAKVLEAQQYYESLDEQVQRQLAEEAENARIQAALEAAEREKEQQRAAEAAREEAEKKAAEEAAQQAQSEQTQQQAEESKKQEKDDGGTSNKESSNNSSSGGKSYGAGGGGLGTAYSRVGCPYEYGATGPGSFDCSGLVCYCYGYERGRSTYDMIESLQSTGSWKTSMDQLVPGDLVFTHEGHVGIYVGGGQMVHAPSPGRSVCQADVYAFIGGGTF